MTVACVPSAGHRPHLRGYQPNKMLLYHSWVGLPLYLAAVCPLQFGESSVIVAFEKLQLGQIVAAKQTNPFDLVIETQFLIDEPTMKLLCEILIFVWFRPNSSWFTAWTPMVRFFLIEHHEKKPSHLTIYQVLPFTRLRNVGRQCGFNAFNAFGCLGCRPVPSAGDHRGSPVTPNEGSGPSGFTHWSGVDLESSWKLRRLEIFPTV